MGAAEFDLRGEELAHLLVPYDTTKAEPYAGVLDETLVRERIFKLFIENSHVDLLINYRDQR
jgi:hypothetical protein